MERTRTDGSPGAVVTADFGHTPARYEALTAALWRERELLDQLLFALTSQRLLLESHTLRWLATSSARIEALVDALREHEVVRAMAAEELAPGCGVTAASLDDLAAAAPEPYAAILHDLGAALRDQAGEVDLAVRRNDDLLLALVRRDADDLRGMRP